MLSRKISNCFPFSTIVVKAWFHRAIQFDVGQFGSADDFLLHFDGKFVPSLQVMKVLLHDHITAAGKGCIFLADDGGLDRGLFHGIFRPIDEADQVAIVEVLEAVHFIGRGDRAAEPRHDQCRQFEAQIHSLGADMKEDVTRRSHGMMPAVDLAERVQVLRPRLSEEPVPRVGAESHDA